MTDGVLYVPCYDNHLYGIHDGGATSFDAALDGDVGRPAVSGDTVVVSTGNQANELFGLNLAGRQEWRGQGLAGSYVPAKTASFAFLGVTDASAVLKAITEDGDEVWSYGGGGALSDPVLVDSTVYVRTDTEVHALDLRGKRLWRTEVGADPGVLLTPLSTAAASTPRRTRASPPWTSAASCRGRSRTPLPGRAGSTCGRRRGCPWPPRPGSC